ncbi:GNAT family N-acetyltransferase [Neisseria sp. Ec49-e6-T10]|uniref:GNAT family N-acetyltransferase n=1 Tax=Neisseria sp. Ec49-e6-T10 TaxID=3140744 RepID=UPI003EB845AB
MNNNQLIFRHATQTDIPLILQFIKELAEYEGLLNEVVATESLLKEWLFIQKKAEVIIGMHNQIPVGFALFFHNFSTFLGRSGIYLEDLYVQPQYRGMGFGRSFIQELAHIATSRGCGRLEWWCLNHNKPSIEFYLSLGAQPMSDWTVFRIDGNRLKELGTKQTVTDIL